MKHVSSLLLSLIFPLVFCAMAVAGDAPTARAPLRPQSDCPRIDRINEWHIVDARTVTVRTGPYRYVVGLQADCPRLGIGNPGLLFRANDANRALGDSRICGEVGETVQARDQPPCAIVSVRKVDKVRFDRLTKQARRNGSGADQPTRPN